MKIAFLCEGYSELDSVVIILNKYNLGNFTYLKQLNQYLPNEDLCDFVIYRHNYKSIGRIRKEYLALSMALIDRHAFSKIFVWFDNEKITPCCDYAKGEYDKIGTNYKDKIELIISVEQLENWFLSNKVILSKVIGQQVDQSYLEDKNVENFLEMPDVDTLNANKILRILKKDTTIERLKKQKIATRFFSHLDLQLEYKSSSLTRFLRKLNETFPNS